jgi:hypothetical protein
LQVLSQSNTFMRKGKDPDPDPQHCFSFVYQPVFVASQQAFSAPFNSNSDQSDGNFSKRKTGDAYGLTRK